MTDDQREILRKVGFSSTHKYLEMRAGHAGLWGRASQSHVGISPRRPQAMPSSTNGSRRVNSEPARQFETITSADSGLSSS